jgi:hypothetical protein
MRPRPPMTVIAARRLLVCACVCPALLGMTAVLADSSSARSPSPIVGNAHTKGPVALLSRRTHLIESAQLHLTSGGESTLNERGRATGTFNAPLTAHLDLSVGHVTAVVTLYPKGGTVTGKAEARFVARGSMAYYGGTLTITRGTGTYRHASGSNIGISGTINRLNFNLTVKANGWITF